MPMSSDTHPTAPHLIHPETKYKKPHSWDARLYQLGIGRVRVEKGVGEGRKVLTTLNAGQVRA
eukprot:1584669-Rhodomonas_salina.1